MPTNRLTPPRPSRSPRTLVSRDYWRICRLEGPTGVVSVELGGRRRTAEPFWSPLALSFDELSALAHSLKNAVTVAAGFAADRSPSCPVYPATHTLAICAAPRYAIELFETALDPRERSIDTIVYALDPGPRPCLLAIEGELTQLATDVDRACQSLLGAAGRAH